MTPNPTNAERAGGPHRGMVRIPSTVSPGRSLRLGPARDHTGELRPGEVAVQIVDRVNDVICYVPVGALLAALPNVPAVSPARVAELEAEVARYVRTIVTLTARAETAEAALAVLREGIGGLHIVRGESGDDGGLITVRVADISALLAATPSETPRDRIVRLSEDLAAGRAIHDPSGRETTPSETEAGRGSPPDFHDTHPHTIGGWCIHGYDEPTSDTRPTPTDPKEA